MAFMSSGVDAEHKQRSISPLFGNLLNNSERCLERNDITLCHRDFGRRLKAFLHATPPKLTPTYRRLPIISGSLIPLSILFAIPGLTGHWYTRAGPRHEVVEVRPNPPGLRIAMSVSMGCVLLANIFLVVRFTERFILLMTLLCIAFLSTHDLINIIVVSIFSHHVQEEGFSFGHSFWSTICSTIISSITNFTLILDLILTTNFQSSGSGLTRTQRSLVIVIITLLCFLALGGLINSILLGISFLDALYFSVTTIETIGLGDIYPTDTSTRVFNCVYAAGGILNLALAVGLIRETFIENMTISLRTRIQRLRSKEREARTNTRWREAVKWRLRADGFPLWVVDDVHPRQKRFREVLRGNFCWPKCRREASRHYAPRGMRLNVNMLTRVQLKECAAEAGLRLGELFPLGYRHEDSAGDNSRKGARVQSPTMTQASIGRMISFLGRFNMAFGIGAADFGQDSSPLEHSENVFGEPEPLDDPAQLELQQNESDAAQAKSEERRAFYAHLFVSWTIFLVFWMVGSALFTVTENWSFAIAMYFCFTSFTTIGYGDFYPTSPAGRALFTVWALLGVAAMTILISILSEAYRSRFGNFTRSDTSIDAGTGVLTAQRIPTFHSADAGPAIYPLPQLPHSRETDEPQLNPQIEALPHQIIRLAREMQSLVGMEADLLQLSAGQEIDQASNIESLFIAKFEDSLLDMIRLAERAVRAVDNDIREVPR